MSDVFRQLQPELLTLGAAFLVIVADLVWPRGRTRAWLGWFSAALAGLVLASLIPQWHRVATPQPLWNGVLQSDQLGVLFKAIFLLGVAITSIGSVEFAAARFRNVGEYYGLLFFSALGMMLMAATGDLLTLYLGLEIATLSLYVLVSLGKDEPRSAEAGLKYVILGAVASAVYIYGASLVYGAAGTTLFSGIARELHAQATPGLLAGAIMILAALCFKVAAVPFHMWAPDVYQGAPTTVTAFLSTASKAAGFAALLRVFHGAIGPSAPQWVLVVGVLAALSMIVGNLLAIPQRDLKRMLAYSGIAQAGYALVGLASPTALGTWATVFFLFQYLFTNLGAFLVVSLLNRGHEDEIVDYNGLRQRNPVLAFALLLLLLSLGGIPPLSGFWGKVFVFWAAIDSGQYVLVLIGVLASVVSLYYYLMVARAMYIEPEETRPAIRVAPAAALAVGLCVALVILLAYPSPVQRLAEQAVRVLFN